MRTADEIGREAAKLLEGRTIERAIVETSSNLEALTLVFTDGTAVKIDHWADYADDSGLEFEAVEVPEE